MRNRVEFIGGDDKLFFFWVRRDNLFLIALPILMYFYFLFFKREYVKHDSSPFLKFRGFTTLHNIYYINK